MGVYTCSPYLAIHACVLGKKRYFESEKKEVRTGFYIFLTFSRQIDASVNHINDFSSIFAANIRSCLFSANDNKCKPGLMLQLKRAVTNCIRSRDADFYMHRFRKWVEPWEHCMERGGDYVEK